MPMKLQMFSTNHVHACSASMGHATLVTTMHGSGSCYLHVPDEPNAKVATVNGLWRKQRRDHSIACCCSMGALLQQ